MQAFINHTGILAPVDRVNVDTDAIIPKQFLKRIERTGFGEFLFYEWRFTQDGSIISGFVLNKPAYKGCSILVSRSNFGCGSSREHAPWALLDYGFKVIIASSFADIFYNNCFKNGILPIKLSEAEVDTLFAKALKTEGYKLTVDLEKMTITDESGLLIKFSVDEYSRECLMKGLDDIGITLLHEDKISNYESQEYEKSRNC